MLYEGVADGAHDRFASEALHFCLENTRHADCVDDGGARVSPQMILCKEQQEVIRRDNSPFFIHESHAVAVPVERNPASRFLLSHGFLERLQRLMIRGIGDVIGKSAVWFLKQTNDFGPSFFERSTIHRTCDAVSEIYDYLESLQ